MPDSGRSASAGNAGNDVLTPGSTKLSPGPRALGYILERGKTMDKKHWYDRLTTWSFLAGLLPGLVWLVSQFNDSEAWQLAGALGITLAVITWAIGVLAACKYLRGL